MFRNLLKLSFIIIFFNCTSNTNFTVTKIKESNPLNPKQSYEFPLLQGDKKITFKINRSTIQSILELDITQPHKSIFENIWATKEKTIPNLSFLNYNINRLDNKLYSITFHTEGCGSYCEEYDISYNYDLNSGNRIDLENLFSEQGKLFILNSLNNQKLNLLNKTIQKLISRKLKLKNKLDLDDLNSRLELLEKCKNESKIDNFDYLDFKIKENVILIYSDRCSNHANNALDEIGEFKYLFEINNIKNLLSKYAKNIL